MIIVKYGSKVLNVSFHYLFRMESNGINKLKCKKSILIITNSNTINDNCITIKK